ncbi:MAG: hypothetical protein ACJ8D2_10915, partial [Sphingomicrobium sp.]
MLILAAILAAASPCPLTLVSGTAGENHVLFHGVSPDGRSVAIGWDSGTGAAVSRGAFLLDLKNGRRTELPQLNN